MTYFPPMPQFPAGPPLQRQIRKVGAPLGVIIAFGTVSGLMVILLSAANPVGAAIGFVLSTLGIAVVVLAYLWLDRWEPEPPRLLLLGFGWGASIAVVVSVGLELSLHSVFAPGSTTPNPASIVIGAPVIEEAAKGLFLLLMMTGRRRHELNSLTDCLVYAGITAAGFAWLEDIVYIANGDSLAHSLLTAAMRLVMAPFAHPLFTTMTGIGVYFALWRRTPLAKAGCILAGYAGAVTLHALWNGSSLLGVGAYFGVYVLWMVPIFALVIVLAITGRRKEQHVVAGKLPGMVAAGLLTPNEATWLGSLRERRAAIREATRIGGRPAGAAVATFAAAVVELAFVRDRIDRGFGDPGVVALLNEQAYAVMTARAGAPMLSWMAAYRAPYAPLR